MDVSFSVPHLRALDDLAADALALPWFSGSYPYPGALGLVDWRLGGWLSCHLGGALDAPVNPAPGPMAGQQWLVGLAGKFPVPRLLLYGMGSPSSFDETRYLDALRALADVAKAAQLRRLSLELPGRALSLIAPSRAIELVFQDQVISMLLDDMTIIDLPQAQQEMMAKLKTLQARQRRRSQAPFPD